MSFSANILTKQWIVLCTCYRVICAYCAYVTIRRTLGDKRCTPRHFVNKVSVRQFSAENKQESAEFYSQHLPMHSRDVIWKIKPKSTLPVSFSLVSAEMNLVGNYRTLRGLRTVNPEGLPSTTSDCVCARSSGCLFLFSNLPYVYIGSYITPVPRNNLPSLLSKHAMEPDCAIFRGKFFCCSTVLYLLTT